MSQTICMYCRGRIDLDRDEIVEVNNKLVHKKCYEQRQQAKNNINNESQLNKQEERKSRKKDIKKCYYCGKEFDIKRRFLYGNC